MPTYEYACSACKHQWEAEQRMSEAALEDCPSCHAKTAKRQISAGNFILKGGGWYSDLYSSAKPSSGSSTSGEGSGTTPSSAAAPATGAPAPAAAPATSTPSTPAAPSTSSGSTGSGGSSGKSS